MNIPTSRYTLTPNSDEYIHIHKSEKLNKSNATDSKITSASALSASASATATTATASTTVNPQKIKTARAYSASFKDSNVAIPFKAVSLLDTAAASTPTLQRKKFCNC